MKNGRALNAVLVVVGVAICILGLNIGLGGIRTLGWQGARDFISITDQAVFATQDSHIRFIGGLWFGFGVLFVAGGFMLERLRQVLIALCGTIALAGLFRFGGPDVQGLASAAIAPSLVLELLGFPVLALWLAKSVGPRQVRMFSIPLAGKLH